MANRYLLYSITPNGRNERFIDRRNGRNYAAPNSPCAHVKRGGKDFPATSAIFKQGLLVLQFAEAKIEAAVRITVKDTYFLVEVISLSGSDIDEFIFADVALTLHGTNGVLLPAFWFPRSAGGADRMPASGASPRNAASRVSRT